jgi:DNA-binding MarR family transcriptional regulator
MNLIEQSNEFLKNYLRCFRNSLIPFNLTQSQALCLLSLPFDGISQTNLSKKLALDLSTLSRNLNHLLKNNLILKTKSDTDLRIYIIQLSPKGQNLYKKLNNNINNNFKNIYSNLDLKDINHVINVLNKLNWQFELEYNG